MESLQGTIILREQGASTHRLKCTDNVGKEERKRGREEKRALKALSSRSERDTSNVCGGREEGTQRGAVASELDTTSRGKKK